MRLHTDPAAFQAACRAARDRPGGGQRSLGLVPTMGALHAGHMSLVAASRHRDDATVATIFVNPLQFGPREDLARYPRRLDHDLAQLEAAGVEMVFAPEPEAMYPAGFATAVEVAGLSERLCGASRPGHFRGVTTVVMKLFALAAPSRAYFGQKDAAQVAVLRRMTCDLNLDVELVVLPIVREADGLAMSSRNAYLSTQERLAALGLSHGLAAIRAAYDRGERDAPRLLAAGQAAVAATPGLRLDYLVAVDADTLLPVAQAGAGTLFAIAAFVGATRLIDNLLIGAKPA
ncbi:MAG: pantoate--beta-alanine ligase [Terriglobales bacterium]